MKIDLHIHTKTGSDGNMSVDDVLKEARKQGLIMTGGSDCHQRPLLLGTLDIPAYVAEQFHGSYIFSP